MPTVRSIAAGRRGRAGLRRRLALRLLELGQSFGEHLAQVGRQVVILQLDPALLRQRHVAAPVRDDAAVPQRPRIVRRDFERRVRRAAPPRRRSRARPSGPWTRHSRSPRRHRRPRCACTLRRKPGARADSRRVRWRNGRAASSPRRHPAGSPVSAAARPRRAAGPAAAMRGARRARANPSC